MIRFESVTKYYPTAHGRHYVLRDASFTIPDGVNVAVLGRNGAGKSTLARLLAGVDIPNEGRIIRTGNISWPMGLTSGLQPSLTGRENARFVCRIQATPVDKIPALLEWIEDFAEIGKFFDLPIKTYSSGMRARLRFGITMAFDFDLYIIDELSAVGDQRFKKKSKLIFEEKRANASYVKVSHNLIEMRNECDAGIIINEGVLTYYSSIDEALAVYTEIAGDDGSDVPVRKAARPVKPHKRAARALRAPVKVAANPPARNKPMKSLAAKRPHKPAPMAPARLPRPKKD